MYEIIFYYDEKGKSEVYEYIESLEKQRNNKDCKIKLEKISAYIDWLSQNGLSIGEPYIKYLKNGIWELRPLRDRILFAYYDNNKFILLTCFMKQIQKTPRKEIERAKKLLKDYKKRGEKHEWKIFNLGRS